MKKRPITCMLACLLSLSFICISHAELSKEAFMFQLTKVVFKNDLARIYYLVQENPTTAKNVQLDLEEAGKEFEGKAAQNSRELARILSGALTKLAEEGDQSTELSEGEFYRQLIDAISKKDKDRFYSLIWKYPAIAKRVQLVLEKKGKGKGEQAQNYRVIETLLSSALEDFPWKARMGRLNKDAKQAFDRAEYKKANEKWEEGLDMAKMSGNRSYIGHFLSSIGGVYEKLGLHQKAISYAEKALSIHRGIGDRREEGKDLSQIGMAYGHFGQYEKAVDFFTQALALHREVGNRMWERQALSAISFFYEKFGEYGKALSYAEKALKINVGSSQKSQEGNGLMNISVVYEKLGLYQEALSSAEKALVIHRELGDRRGEAGNLTNIGILYSKLGDYDQSLSYYEKALVIHGEMGNRKWKGFTLSDIGALHLIVGQYERGLRFFQQAIKIHQVLGDRRGEGRNFINIGEAYLRLGHYYNAERSFLESMKICQEVNSLESLWRTQRGLASVEVKLNRDDAAFLHYSQALDTIEAMREDITDKEARIWFMHERIFVYDEFIALLTSLHKKHPDEGYDKKSLEIFERKQGRVFLEEMGRSGARNFAGIPDEVLRKEVKLKVKLAKLRKDRIDEVSKPEIDRNMTRISNLERQIQEVTGRQQILEKRIRTDYPDYYALKHPKPVQLTDLQQNVLKPVETVLAYNVMEDQTCLWVVNKTHFSLHTIEVGEKALKGKIALYRRNGIALPGRDLRGKAVYRTPKTKEIPDLYAILFPEPARVAMSSSETVYIVPTGPLYLLPFETLKDKDNRYLIERQAISYLSSSSLLKILRDAQARKKDEPNYPLLAFANPVYQKIESKAQSISELRSASYRALMGGAFTELPETEDEARAIKQILNAPDDSKPLRVKSEASLSTVFSLNRSRTLKDYRYLVFACHGIIPGEITRVKQPALVLSNPDPKTHNAGFLTMADVFDLSLNADLVTLSACNTGRGKSVKGEGIMGLTRAFMFAGTPAVSVTLWSVESMSAKALNVGFFKHLKAGNTRADALRDIKLSMIRGDYGDEWKKPYYWAPVVLFGDGR